MPGPATVNRRNVSARASWFARAVLPRRPEGAGPALVERLEGKRRILAASVVLAAVLVTAAACGGGEESANPPEKASSSSTTPTPRPTTSATATPSPTASTTATASGATGAEQTLADIGVSDGQVKQLIALADELGYGPATKDFAWVMADTCRDVKAGASTYPELVDADVANGASRADAQRMYDWLKTSFCPDVKAATDLPAPGQSGGQTPALPAGLQGLGGSVKWFDAKFKPSSQAPCRAVQGAPLGIERAYVFAPGVTLCLDYMGNAPLGDVQDAASLVFSPLVSQSKALAAVARLLPKDAQLVDQLKGSNPDYAGRPGSCLSVLYRSPTWKQQMSQYDDLTDPAGITYDTSLDVMLYSDRQTADGSSSEYTGMVRYADLTSGGHNFGYHSRTVTC